MRSRSTRPSRVLLAGIATLALTLTACGEDGTEANADEGTATRIFAADNGEIEIPTDPERIVATGYAVPALVEAEADLVGISTWERGLAMMTEEDRARYDEIDKIAGETAAETNYEAVAEAEPDLIVIGVPLPVLGDVDMDRLESIAPVVVLGPSLPDSWKELTQRQLDAAGELARWESDKVAYEAKAAELAEKYAGVLGDLRFGHVGAYGDVSAGNFHREFAGSWGTNIATDIGVQYYGEVKKKGGGSEDVSEYPSIEELPESLGEADAITYTLDPDGSSSAEIQYVLDSKLWANLPAVEQGRAIGLRYTEAATYRSALLTLDAIDSALAPLLS